jgi:hypothetical protein
MNKPVPAASIEPRRSPAGGYVLAGVAEFDDLITLLHFAEEHNIEIAESSELLGFEIGGLIVRLNEGEHDLTRTQEALAETTDGAYVAGARYLAKILTSWADEMEPAEHLVALDHSGE